MSVPDQQESRDLDGDYGPSEYSDWYEWGGSRCKVCDCPISYAELCGECAKGNDPFVTTKWGQRHGRNP